MDGVQANTPRCMRRSSTSKLRKSSDAGSRRVACQVMADGGANGNAGGGQGAGAGGASAATSASPNGVCNNLVGAVGSVVDSVSSRPGCSVKAIHDIISRFDDRKRLLVESIGFGGLLKFPAIKTTNRKFSAWLMGLVDVRNSCLALVGGSRLAFCGKDVGLVFGIPATGRNVNEAGQLSKIGKEKMKLRCWPLSGKDQHSIKAVEELVDTKYNDGMTADQEDAFKVAFVVFVMSTLFVPGAKHDYAHVDYWGALSNPSIIHEFDWAGYIHKRLLVAAAKFKADIETSSKTPIITGCYLFLQVFYLDNMEIPVWGMDHGVQPRISCFTYDRIRNMIAADTHERHDARNTFVYGKTKVRPREQSCYTWAQTTIERPTDAEREADISLWHAVVSMVAILKAAGPLFLAAAEFNRNHQEPRPRSGIECIVILLIIMEPFVKGFNYNFDLQPTLEDNLDVQEQLRRYLDEAGYTGVSGRCKCKERTCGVVASSSASGVPYTMFARPEDDTRPRDRAHPKRTRLAAHSTTEEMSGKALANCQETIGGFDSSVIKTISRFYKLLQYARERNRLDLNTASAEIDGCQGVSPIEEVHVLRGARSPWELGSAWDYNSMNQRVLPGGIEGATNSRDGSFSTMPRIVDYSPKYIEVMPGPAHDQRLGFSEMEMDMFDAIIRCFKQHDDKLYCSEGRLRWRHFLESDVLAAIIAGWFDIDNPCMRNQFIGPHLSYDLYNCSMLFFPVILHERWVCFSWNLKENEIVVFDPACMNIPGFSRRSIYKHVVDALKNILSSAMPALIPGWDHDWAAATVSPFHWRYAGMAWSNRTGVLCAYFCRCFDGQKLQPDLDQGHVGKIAEMLFAEVSKLHEARLHTGGSLC